MTLFGEERKEKIVELVLAQSSISVTALSERFQVSESTIRRDLKELEEANLLRRTHGGAIAFEGVNFEPTFTEKEDTFRKEKECIAKRAVQLIEDGDTILLDSGTTLFHLVKELKAFNKLTVVTNSLIFAQELQNHPGLEVVIIGGSLRNETLALVGPLAEETLSKIRVDKAFIGTNGLDLQAGLTTPNLMEAATKRKMIEIAKQVILLTDHSKIGRIAFAKVADSNNIDKIIIDDAVPESFINESSALGIEICTVRI